jgi:hypothetical protein
MNSIETRVARYLFVRWASVREYNAGMDYLRPCSCSAGPLHDSHDAPLIGSPFKTQS